MGIFILDKSTSFRLFTNLLSIIHLHIQVVLPKLLLPELPAILLFKSPLSHLLQVQGHLCIVVWAFRAVFVVSFCTHISP